MTYRQGVTTVEDIGQAESAAQTNGGPLWPQATGNGDLTKTLASWHRPGSQQDMSRIKVESPTILTNISISVEGGARMTKVCSFGTIPCFGLGAQITPPLIFRGGFFYLQGWHKKNYQNPKNKVFFQKYTNIHTFFKFFFCLLNFNISNLVWPYYFYFVSLKNIILLQFAYLLFLALSCQKIFLQNINFLYLPPPIYLNLARLNCEQSVAPQVGDLRYMP